MSTTKEPKPKLRAVDMEALLRSHYSSPEYAVITGVRNAAGFNATRTCDLLAIGTWKGTHLHVHGVEIKVDRGDWLREIQDPLKAEAFAQHCDFWWIAAPAGVVEFEELAAPWGLLEPAGRGLRVRRPATLRTDPKPVSRSFLACIARRVVEQSPAEQVIKEAATRARQAVRAEYEKLEEARRQREREMVGRAEYDRMAGLLAAFSKHAGVSLSEWNVEQEGDRFRRFVAAERGVNEVRSALQRLKGVVEEALVRSEGSAAS